MFNKLMNNFYYGKSGKGDYRQEDLPETRWQLFWEMLKIRLSALCRLNLMYAVVWLPAMFVIFSGVTSWYNVLAGLGEAQAAVEALTLTAEEYAIQAAASSEAFKAIILQTLFILIPAIAITGPATAGVAYVTRNWARDEHAFIWSDFRDAVKENWKQALAVSSITGLMPVILYVCWMFYGDMATQNMLFVIPQALTVMLTVLWMCSLTYLYPLMVTYRLKFSQLLRNGLLLTVGRLPMSLGLKLLSLVPALIAAVVSFLTPYFIYAVMILGLYYIVFGFALSRFVGVSYANSVFDRYINPQIEGAEVGRGLHTPDEDDEGDEPGDYFSGDDSQA